MLINTIDNKTFYSTCVIEFVIRFQWSIAITSLPIYIHELGGSSTQVGLLFSTFAGITIFALSFWGKLSDKVRKRKVFISLGMISIVPIFIALAYNPRIYSIIILRGSTAIFIGAIIPVSVALISDISPPQVIGRNLGILGSVGTIGSAIGSIIGGVMADFVEYKIVWLSVASICLLGGLLFIILASDPPDLKKISKGMSSTSFKKIGFNNKLMVLSLSNFIFVYGQSLLGPNYNVYLVEKLGLSKSLVGIVFFIGIGLTTFLQPLIGNYSDRYGRKLFLKITLCSLIFANIVLAISKNVLGIILVQVLVAFSNLFAIIGLAYIVYVSSPKDKSGSSGIFSSFGSASRALGPIIGGMLINSFSYRTVILISAIFPAISIILVQFALREE
jgi:DHA1 family multidrug resistance protein-like MFS transporter